MGAFHFGVIKILHLCWWPKGAIESVGWNPCLSPPRAQDTDQSQGLVSRFVAPART